MKHDAGFKLKIVEFVKKSNNSSAGRHFDVSEALVRDCSIAENILRNMLKEKAKARGPNWKIFFDGRFSSTKMDRSC